MAVVEQIEAKEKQGGRLYNAFGAGISTEQLLDELVGRFDDDDLSAFPHVFADSGE